MGDRESEKKKADSWPFRLHQNLRVGQDFEFSQVLRMVLLHIKVQNQQQQQKKDDNAGTSDLGPVTMRANRSRTFSGCFFFLI